MKTLELDNTPFEDMTGSPYEDYWDEIWHPNEFWSSVGYAINPTLDRFDLLFGALSDE